MKDWGVFADGFCGGKEVVDTANEPLDGRLVQYLLHAPVGDGGQWDMVVNLVEKYGLVPQTVFPDSFNAKASGVYYPTPSPFIANTTRPNKLVDNRQTARSSSAPPPPRHSNRKARHRRDRKIQVKSDADDLRRSHTLPWRSPKAKRHLHMELRRQGTEISLHNHNSIRLLPRQRQHSLHPPKPQPHPSRHRRPLLPHQRPKKPLHASPYRLTPRQHRRRAGGALRQRLHGDHKIRSHKHAQSGTACIFWLRRGEILRAHQGDPGHRPLRLRARLQRFIVFDESAAVGGRRE